MEPKMRVEWGSSRLCDGHKTALEAAVAAFNAGEAKVADWAILHKLPMIMATDERKEEKLAIVGGAGLPCLILG